MMRLLQRTFFGGPFGIKIRINDYVTIWGLEGKSGGALKVRAAGGHYFAKLTESDVKALRNAADHILKTNGQNP